MDKKNTNTKATIRVEQFDNGITLKWAMDGETEHLVATDSEKERVLGKMVWEDIKHLMDNYTCNQVVLNIEYKEEQE